jgi:3-oxoacyl-ACP reductase-like protein
MDSKLQELIEPRFQQFQEEIRALILSTPAPVAPAATEAAAPSEAASAIPSTPISATKSMKIAEHLQTILESLKMGCTSGDVLDAIAESKDNISKIVESDPITVKIDRWASDVSKTPKRKELQAREILKIKKELRAEIEKYSPA